MPKILKHPSIKQLNIKFTWDEWHAIKKAAKQSLYTGPTAERDWVKKLILESTRERQC